MSATHLGWEKYLRSFEFSKEGLKCLSPSSIIKCGTVCDFGRQTDFEKIHGVLLKLFLAGGLFWRCWHYQQPFLLDCVGKLHPVILLSELELSSFDICIFCYCQLLLLLLLLLSLILLPIILTIMFSLMYTSYCFLLIQCFIGRYCPSVCKILTCCTIIIIIIYLSIYILYNNNNYLSI